MNVILVLSNTHKQFKENIGRIWQTPSIKVSNAQTCEELVGYRPVVIIELPNWSTNKSTDFIDRVKQYKQQLMRKSV